MNDGEGRYAWVGTDGVLREGTTWHDLPQRMRRIVAFVPAAPPEPHDQADHDYIESFSARFREAMSRCRR